MGPRDIPLQLHPGSLAPKCPQALCHFAYSGVFFRPKVPGALKSWPGPQPLGQAQVTGQRFQDVLPRSHRLGKTQPHRIPGGKGAQTVGHQSVSRPVTASDHVARSGAGDAHPLRLQKRRSITGRNQLGGRLAGAIRIVPPQRIRLAVRIDPLLIVIDLVGGDDHHRPHRIQPAHRFQQMGRAQYVGGEGANRVHVAFPHQRLGGQMENDLRLTVA